MQLAWILKCLLLRRLNSIHPSLIKTIRNSCLHTPEALCIFPAFYSKSEKNQQTPRSRIPGNVSAFKEKLDVNKWTNKKVQVYRKFSLVFLLGHSPAIWNYVNTCIPPELPPGTRLSLSPSSKFKLRSAEDSLVFIVVVLLLLFSSTFQAPWEKQKWYHCMVDCYHSNTDVFWKSLLVHHLDHWIWITFDCLCSSPLNILWFQS